MAETTINDVSDTALWVAAFRAIESERRDALFKDTLAGKLAGDKGFKIVDATPARFRKIMSYVMAIRTVAIDRLIVKAMGMGIDTVVNLGAGLDTRPYRMNLPTGMKWVEIDFPGMIEYKNNALQNEKPRCKMQRIAADLSDVAEREKIFTQLSRESKEALVITEGVIPYLTNDEASDLSRSLYKVPAFRLWIQDYRQGAQAVRQHPKGLAKMLTNAPFKFTEEDPLKFFEGDGWKVNEVIHMQEEGKQKDRSFPLPFPWNMLLPFSPKMTDKINEAYGYVMFEKG